jgi:hypothetical protein
MNEELCFAKQSLRDEIAVELMLRLASNPGYLYHDDRMIYAAFKLADDTVNRISADVEALKTRFRMEAREKAAEAKDAAESANDAFVEMLKQALKGA